MEPKLGLCATERKPLIVIKGDKEWLEKMKTRNGIKIYTTVGRKVFKKIINLETEML
jgi:hypothetical protein